MKIKSVIFILFWMIISLPPYLNAQIKPIPPPLATKEEINQFFTAYVDRYTQKDINGFLSFFSLKAIQNQKEGLEEIRKNYTNFFNQSLALKYFIEEMGQEIYQNAVEVKARYVINQVLKGDGKEREWSGPIRWVLVKEDGALKILSLDYQHMKLP
jgi:ketosteroid isomerase-like protein